MISLTRAASFQSLATSSLSTINAATFSSGATFQNAP
jgi:hypothetical protein